MHKEVVVHVHNGLFSSVQFSSVAQSCPTLCDPMNRSTPGLPVHHHLPEIKYDKEYLNMKRLSKICKEYLKEKQSIYVIWL